jgi:hypothetical protein
MPYTNPKIDRGIIRVSDDFPRENGQIIVITSDQSEVFHSPERY